MAQIENIYSLHGLSETEIAIMEALSLARNVQDTARMTNISRTGINYRLSSLLRRGFIRLIRNGKKRTYIAHNPDELMDMLQDKLAEIRTSHKRKGVRIKTTKEDEFIIHVGTKEIIPAYARIASENKNERIRAIQHHRSYNELLKRITPTQLISFNETVIKNHLIIDGILNESAYKAYREEIESNPQKYKKEVESLEGRMADYTFFADNYFDYNAELWLFKNTSLLINWHDEVAIEITNKQITAFLKDMFEFVKKDGQKVDHNRAIRGVLETNK